MSRTANFCFSGPINSEEVDLNSIESFEMFVPEDTAANINFEYFIDNNNKKCDIMNGFLDSNQEHQFDLYHFMDISHSLFQTIVNRFQVCLDNQYSIAVNTEYLKIEDLENYSYAGLLNTEAEALLKSAKIFNAWMQSCHFNDKTMYLVAQALVDKIYHRILQISSFLSQRFN